MRLTRLGVPRKEPPREGTPLLGGDRWRIYIVGSKSSFFLSQGVRKGRDEHDLLMLDAFLPEVTTVSTMFHDPGACCHVVHDLITKRRKMFNVDVMLGLGAAVKLQALW